MKASHPLLVVAVFCVPATAFAGPRDDLLRLVPDDYTFCVVVQNLRGQGKSGGDGSWLKGFAESPLIKQMETSPEAKKVQAAIEAIFKDLGASPEQVRDDILGDAVIFAYRKGPPGQQDSDDGIILVHARDDKLLARIVDRINELQIKGREVKAVESVGRDRQYFRRLKAVETEKADYYALRGHKLLFSGSEDLLKGMLASLERGETSEPALAKRMKALGVNDSPAAMLINPRAFDSEFAESAKT